MLCWKRKKYKEKYDVCIDLDITSPLRKVSDIKNAFKNFKNKNSSVLFLLRSLENPYFNMVEETNNIVNSKNQIRYYSRQNAPSVFDMNASIYIWKRYKILKSDNLYGAKTSIYEMPLDRSIDIDEELDFKIVKMLLKNENFVNPFRLNNKLVFILGGAGLIDLMLAPYYPTWVQVIVIDNILIHQLNIKQISYLKNLICLK